MTHPQNPGFYRLPLGAFSVVALHDGILVRDRPAGFVRNAPDDAVGEAFAAAGMARDKLTITFTPLAVETPGGTVLIDTGFGDGGPPTTGRLAANLRAAGIDPDGIAHVLISHLHGDHILGLRRQDGSPIYPHATIHVPEPDWVHWMDDAVMAAAPEAMRSNYAVARRVFGPGLGEVRHFNWGDEVLPGITAVDASGHTPGMTAFDIESEGERLMFVADITNNPLLFVRHPEWQAMFDMDGDKATATRRRLLDQAAAETRRLHFFHAPFPGQGTVVKHGDTYEYLPSLWV